VGGRIEIWMPSSKRLFILRHAKSSWDDPGLAVTNARLPREAAAR
jgi:hypothetical protein